MASLPLGNPAPSRAMTNSPLNRPTAQGGNRFLSPTSLPVNGGFPPFDSGFQILLTLLSLLFSGFSSFNQPPTIQPPPELAPDSRPDSMPDIRTASVLNALNNADNRGNSDGLLGRYELRDYRNFLDTEIIELADFDNYQKAHGNDVTQDDYKNALKAEYDATNHLIKATLDIYNLDGDGASISEDDIRLAEEQAVGGITADGPTSLNTVAPEPLVNTWQQAILEGYGEDHRGGLGRFKMLDYRQSVEERIEKAGLDGEDTTALKAEYDRINFIIKNASEISGLDGNGASISAEDLRQFVA